MTKQRQSSSGFRLPAEISFVKEHGPTGWVYSFRHRELGQLGRIVLHGRPDGRCQVTSEIAGDPDDPMTETRKSVFGPLAIEITRQMDLATGGTGETRSSAPEPDEKPRSAPQGFPSKHMQCRECDALVAVLIFANEARDTSDLEDCARLMFPRYREWGLPTWVIGPDLGDGPPSDRPAPVMKVWPNREPIQELRPDEFNPIIAKLASSHCR